MICPKCNNDEHFLQRVVEVWDYHFRASEDFECESPYDEEWQDEVDWDESEFRDRQQVIGIFCGECGQLLISNSSDK